MIYHDAILDDDECEELGGMCSQRCNNTPGSYHCECNNGYRLTSDGFTCEGTQRNSYIYIVDHYLFTF